jgi:radical SAM protein with 4Fe4S-binding SPASM domain
MGGEVFLRKDWENISKEIKDLGITLSIISNGYFSPDQIIKKLRKLELDSLSIGLDAVKPEAHDKIRRVKGSFEKASKFIIAAKQAGIPTSIITTVHKKNFKQLPKILDFVINQEVDWQIQEATPIGRFPKELVLSEEEYYTLGLYIYSLQKKINPKKNLIVGTHNFGFHSKVIPKLCQYPDWNGCPAGKTVLGLQSNGNVKGCLALSDKFIEGNIRKKSIVDIWNDHNSFAYNRKFKLNDIGENCRSCIHSKNCKGGCTTRSDSLTGIPHNDPFCFYRIEKEILK